MTTSTGRAPADMDAPTDTRPDTYLLQRAIDAGLAAIAARLDPHEAYRPFFALHLQPSPRLDHDIWDLGDMCSRYVDAYLLGRQVTGYAGHTEEEAALKVLLHKCDPYANPFMATRMMIAYVDEHLHDPSPQRRAEVDGLVHTIRGRMTFEKDYAYYFRQPPGWSSWDDAVFGSFTGYPTYPLGGIILALARYLECCDAPEAEDLLDRLCRFVINVSGTFRSDGAYRGHTHSGGILTAAAGVFRWALLKGHADVLAQMKGAFDWTAQNSSSWGWVPDGLGRPMTTSETCSITDAVHLALLIARSTDPSYYGVVERYVRNHLLESQFVRPELVLPDAGRNAVGKALRGSWASCSDPNGHDGGLGSNIEGCCLGSGIRGCFLAWDHVIEKQGGTVRVNLAFSRNSPWAEVISYQPYEGRIDVIVREPARFEVKIPVWVPESQLRVSVDGRLVPARLSASGYVRVDGLKAEDRVRIDYPQHRCESVEMLCGREYRAVWRGDTVVGISPCGETYPLYERSHLEEAAPLVQRRPYHEQTGGPVHW